MSGGNDDYDDDDEFTTLDDDNDVDDDDDDCALRAFWGVLRKIENFREMVYIFFATFHLGFDLFQLTYTYIELKSNAA